MAVVAVLLGAGCISQAAGLSSTDAPPAAPSRITTGASTAAAMARMKPPPAPLWRGTGASAVAGAGGLGVVHLPAAAGGEEGDGEAGGRGRPAVGAAGVLPDLDGHDDHSGSDEPDSGAGHGAGAGLPAGSAGGLGKPGGELGGGQGAQAGQPRLGVPGVPGGVSGGEPACRA